MIGIATGSIRTEGHAVATPLQRDTIQKRALWRLGSDCDRAPDLPPPSMCVSAAAARSRLHCPPFTGRCREGRCQPEGNHCSKLHTLQDLISDVRRLVVQHDIQQGEVDLHDAVVM
jgi:hypothetical protein